MNTLYVLEYKNYYNRQVKGFQNINEYPDPVGVFSADFKPNDGINTQQIINLSSTGGNDWRGDYLIVCADDNVTILSRWYIIEAVRTCAGQYSVSLLRDVLYDHYQEILNAPCFIERATLSLGNPFLFNKENMSFNQIKKEERLLKDEFENPWIIGYVARNLDSKLITVPAETVTVDYEVSSLGDYEYDQYTEKDAVVSVGNPIIGLNYFYRTTFTPPLNILDNDRTYSFTFNTSGNPVRASYWENYLASQNIRSKSGSVGEGEGYRFTESLNLFELSNILGEELKKKNLYMNYSTYSSATIEPNLLEEEGKIIRVDDKYYQIHITKNSDNQKEVVEVNQHQTVGIIAKQVRESIDNIEGLFSNPEDPIAMLEFSYPTYRVSYFPISVASYQVTIPGQAGRTRCSDAPYDIFAIPYANYLFEDPNISTHTRANKDTMMRIAMAISWELGENLYDLQLLPYTPLPVGSYGKDSVFPTFWDVESRSKHATYIYGENEAVIGHMFWLNSSSFQVAVGKDVSIGKPADAVTAKIMNETQKYRICSPNYNGIFEISPAMNDGLRDFTAYCTYKPITPYIQITPAFNQLYGGNFQDARGLICGGDFSLPRGSDAWISYMNNNKNFENIFNRQLTNLEVNNQIAREQAQYDIFFGALGAGLQGGMIGMGIGNAYGRGGTGALIGGAGSAILSAAGGMKDYDILKKQQNEAIDYTNDMHALQLGNIQAQPYSLSKVSAFNINNKIFPFLEIYTATQEEVLAFMEHLKYNGMTVNAIGTINEYRQLDLSFIKGKILRLEDLGDDYHIVEAIAAEIGKGVYI